VLLFLSHQMRIFSLPGNHLQRKNSHVKTFITKRRGHVLLRTANLRMMTSKPNSIFFLSFYFVRLLCHTWFLSGFVVSRWTVVFFTLILCILVEMRILTT
jgi:hypothetical protein